MQAIITVPSAGSDLVNINTAILFAHAWRCATAIRNAARPPRRCAGEQQAARRRATRPLVVDARRHGLPAGNMEDALMTKLAEFFSFMGFVTCRFNFVRAPPEVEFYADSAPVCTFCNCHHMCCTGHVFGWKGGASIKRSIIARR